MPKQPLLTALLLALALPLHAAENLAALTRAARGWPFAEHDAADGVERYAKLVVNGNFVECALPCSEIPAVKTQLAAGKTVKFSFRVKNGGGTFKLAARHSVSKETPFAFHTEWTTHWTNEVEFALEKK